jgi:hypothetical protein
MEGSNLKGVKIIRVGLMIMGIITRILMKMKMIRMIMMRVMIKMIKIMIMMTINNMEMIIRH